MELLHFPRYQGGRRLADMSNPEWKPSSGKDSKEMMRYPGQISFLSAVDNTPARDKIAESTSLIAK